MFQEISCGTEKIPKECEVWQEATLQSAIQIWHSCSLVYTWGYVREHVSTEFERLLHRLTPGSTLKFCMFSFTDLFPQLWNSNTPIWKMDSVLVGNVQWEATQLQNYPSLGQQVETEQTLCRCVGFQNSWANPTTTHFCSGHWALWFQSISPRCIWVCLYHSSQQHFCDKYIIHLWGKLVRKTLASSGSYNNGDEATRTRRYRCNLLQTKSTNISCKLPQLIVNNDNFLSEQTE